MLEKWTQLWLSLRAPLAHLPIVGDLGPYAALTLAVWAVVWAVRRYRPSWWARLLRLGIDPEGALSHFVQAVPGAIIGALLAGGTTLDVEEAAYGLLFGLFAAPLHHLVKLSPMSYQGALRDRANLYAKAMKGIGLSLVLLALTGCIEPRHPERNNCYLKADGVAAQEYVTLCADYPDTRVCPEGDAIEERHGKALEACK